MCDTLCAVGAGRTLFAKNSDRPCDEVQVVEAFPARAGGGVLRTQYLEISDAGSCALVASRPAWLWGFEHGVNEHRVAIGNEAVYTTGQGSDGASALIGMDLVRLGLERGESAAHAVEVMSEELERHGQGGSCFETGGSYDSSFLVADPTEAWVFETSGRTWAAKRFADEAAISNRLTLRDDWDRASRDVEVGADFDRYRDLAVGTNFADVRLNASRACVARGMASLSARELAAHLRHHGQRPWGAPGSDSQAIDPLPVAGSGDSEFSVCMHIRGALDTTSGMVCELPQDPTQPLRAWIALGSPCASIFVPVFPPHDVSPELGDEKSWRRFAELRDRAERDDHALAEVRSALAPVEAELWREADAAAGDRSAQRNFASTAWPRIEAALDRLA